MISAMRRERVTTFGHIEEWTPADLERYRRFELPKLLEAGTKTICLANHFENNMNTWGVWAIFAPPLTTKSPFREILGRGKQQY